MEVFWLTLGVLAVNILGEVFWWRGVVIPRQAAAFGAVVWLVLGLFWNGYHAYKMWDLIHLLPHSLGLSFAVPKSGKSTPALINHLITNGVGKAPSYFQVLGGKNRYES